MKQKEQGRVIKWAIYCLLICLTAGFGNLRAQTFPAWDIQPDLDLANSPSPGAFWGNYTFDTICAGSGQSFYGISENEVFQWTEIGGWQVIGTFSTWADCMAVQGSYLYVGGGFTGVSDSFGNYTNASGVAKYDLSTGRWSPIGNNSLTKEALSIAVTTAGTVYVGGSGFNSISDVDCSHLTTNMLLKYNGSGWATVGGGMDSGALGCNDTNSFTFEPYMSVLTTDGTNIFAAGGFSGAWQTTGAYVPSRGIIKWDGTNWMQIGTNETLFWETNYTGILSYYTNEAGIEQINDPWAMAISGTNLFVVGPFLYPHSCVARFSTVNGNALPVDDLSLAGVPLNGNSPPPAFGASVTKMGLASQNGLIYLTGDFDHVGSVAASGIACWANDGSTSGSWSALGSGLTYEGAPAGGQFLAANDSEVFVLDDYGTWFDSAGGLSLPNSPSIARWITSTPTVSFTSGSLDSLGLVANPPNYSQTNVFSFTVSGTPNSIWTVYSCGDLGGDWQPIGTIELGADGTGSFTDPNSGVVNWFQDLYQLSWGEQTGTGGGYNSPGILQSDIFGYDLYGYFTWNFISDNTAVSNPLAPLSSNVNSVLQPSTMYDSSGNQWTPPSDGSVFFDDIEDGYDHQWEGGGWDSGGTSFGYGDTLWLYGFDEATIVFIGTVPPGTYGLY